MTTRAHRDIGQHLHDILAAVDRIKRAEQQLSTADQARDEAAAQIAYDAVLYNLVVIGEAVNALPDEIVAREPDVPWRDIVDMRNFLSHEYFRVLADVVRRTIDEPLEQLRTTCQRLRVSLSPDDERPAGVTMDGSRYERTDEGDAGGA